MSESGKPLTRYSRTLLATCLAHAGGIQKYKYKLLKAYLV